jgi:putative FmdB family regulatory protein
MHRIGAGGAPAFPKESSVPLYEYVCRKCSHPFEELVYGGEKAACPKCKNEDVEKVMSVFAVGHGGGEAAPMACGTGACGLPSGGCGMGGCGMN